MPSSSSRLSEEVYGKVDIARMSGDPGSDLPVCPAAVAVDEHRYAIRWRKRSAKCCFGMSTVCTAFAVFLFGTPSFLPTFVSIKWKERLSSGQSTLKLSFRTKFSRVRKEKENWERCGNHLPSLSDRPFLLYPCNSVLGVSLIGEGIVSLVVLRHLRRFSPCGVCSLFAERAETEKSENVACRWKCR